MDIQTIIYCAVLIFFMAIVLTSLIDEKRAKISATPTLPSVSRTAFTMLNKSILGKEINHIAEFGCGWGGILIKLRKKFPKASIKGYEIAFWPYLTSLIRTFPYRKCISVCKQDFMNDDISQFDLIYCYLSPNHMIKIKEKLENTRSGIIILSNAFEIPGWKPKDIAYTGKFIKIPVYLYITS